MVVHISFLNRYLRKLNSGFIEESMSIRESLEYLTHLSLNSTPEIVFGPWLETIFRCEINIKDLDSLKVI